MASIIQLKTGTGSAIPTSLTQGEIAINIDSGLFYFGSGSGNNVKNLANFTHITASGNISSSGNISTTGHITASGNAIVVGTVNANAFVGDGSGLTNISTQAFTNITASGNVLSSGSIVHGNVSASGNIVAGGFISSSGRIQTLSHITASGNISASGDGYFSNIGVGTKSPQAELHVIGDISGSGHLSIVGDITSSGKIIGTRGFFEQTIITLSSTDISNEVSPFVVKIADDNGEDEKLKVNYEGVLKFGALNTLPTAITGGLVYSASNFYVGLS
tara:strand:+ start:1045 stop:1869 length:825 start_codon:yes stop_codon:yes gene_type:complete